MTTTTQVRAAADGVRPGRQSLMSRILTLMSLHRQRTHLAELDDHILRDIGIDREAARREAARPVWDAPNHWYR